MRIVFVGSRWDYGDPRRGDSFEFVTFFRTLVADGHEVQLFDPIDARAKFRSDADRVLEQAVQTYEPDVVLCVIFREEIPPSTLRRIRDGFRIPVVNWFCDDHWRYDDFSRKFAPSLTLSVTTSSRAAEKYVEDGFPVLLSQWGYPDKVLGVPDVVVQPESDVVFVGQAYGDRGEVLGDLAAELASLGRVQVFGFGTSGGRVTPSEMILLFNRSAASVNFSASWQPNLVGRLRRGYFRPRRIPRQLKARVFEVTGAGGLLLTERADDLSRYFVPDEEVLVFDGRRELSELACAAIEDVEWRTRIAERGRRRCLLDHTMSHRIDDVLRATVGQ